MIAKPIKKEISWRNEAGLNDVFPQERGEYLMETLEDGIVNVEKRNETV